VNFDLPEHYRSKVNIGDKVVIAPESIKTLTLAGKLSEIDSLPVNQIRWDRNSPKIYHSTVTLDNQAPELVSGMSVNIEIITKVLKSVLYLPVEAVFEKGGEYFVYLKTLTKPEKIKVEIGLSSDDFVEIKEGLSEGDSVYLYRPFKTSRGK
jgi:multidrug efflux pump subunit AcrA (membrane-fusion protein)